MMNLGLYIHIPFCVQKCRYCDFVSFENGNQDIYFDALFKETEMYKKFIQSRKTDTIFIGGGTPSAVNPCYIQKLLDILNPDSDCEITIETNPKTLTEEKLKIYKESGINRISIGMQSANDNELLYLGRIHNFDDFKKSYEMILNAGFKNINIDTMFGIPMQNLKSFENTLNEVLNLSPTHISSYSLIVEEGTPFYKMELPLPSESEEREMYVMLKEKLKDYERYEISNFAKKGYECKHNLKYWTMEDYLGLGLNSHSFVNNIRFSNTSSLEEYINLTRSEKKPVILSEKEDDLELLKDTIITGLRLSEGINIKKINKKFGIDFYEKYKRIIEKYIDGGFLEIKKENLCFTDKGFSVSNYILSDFI